MYLKYLKKVRVLILFFGYIILFFIAPFLFDFVTENLSNLYLVYAQNDLKNASCIVFNEENYVKTVKSIEANPLNYEGKSILSYGIVLKPYKNCTNGFYLSRIYIWCCAADAVTIGFPVEWTNAYTLKEGEWVKVSGLINVKKVKTNKNTKYTPFIQAISVSKINRMKSQYVY